MDYKPSEAVLAKLPQVILVAVIGPTAVGKTTLLNAAAARCPALHPVVATTTRPPRPGEENGVDMRFCDRESVEARIQRGEYAQVTPSSTGDIYATAPEDYATGGISVMAILADAMPSFYALPFQAIRPIFVLPPSWEVWQERLAGHGFTSEQLEKRLQEAGRSLSYAINTPNLSFVINDDLADATLDFTQVALGGDTQATNQYKARDLAAMLFKELQNR